MDNRKFFKDKVIVITVASSGIGRASALKLASYGIITNPFYKINNR